MKADDHFQKTHNKNSHKFLLRSRSKEFGNEAEKIRQAWGLPMKDWERLSRDPHSLDQVIGLFMFEHLPKLLLKMEAFFSSDVDSVTVLTIFDVMYDYIIKHRPADRVRTSLYDEFVKGFIDIHGDPAFSIGQLLCLADSPPGASPVPDGPPQELKREVFQVLEQDPNRSKTLVKMEELSRYVGLAETLFLKDMTCLLKQFHLGTEWLPTLLAYLFTGSEAFAAQHVPPVNADARNYVEGTLIRTGLHTKLRDLEALYSFLKRENTTSVRHNYPSKNLERDISNLDKKKTFKANKQNYDEKEHTSCFDYPTNWQDVAAAYYTRVLRKGKKFSLLSNEKKIDTLANTLKRGALRAQNKIKESFNRPNTP